LNTFNGANCRRVKRPDTGCSRLLVMWCMVRGAVFRHTAVGIALHCIVCTG